MQRFVIGMAALLISGCAGMSPAQVGQTAGTIAGSALIPGIGAPVGALVGLLAGMVVQKRVDQVVEKRERHDLNQQLVTRPRSSGETLRPPQGEPTRAWVDETFHNGRVVAGHFEARHIP